jgi:hypothetical protein
VTGALIGLKIVTITSTLHGERTFRCIRLEPYRRSDGTETELAVWQGDCVVCGGPFEVKTPAGTIRAEQSKSFESTTCPAHKMTPGEVSRLRFAKPGERPTVFGRIKAAKLSATATPEGQS